MGLSFCYGPSKPETDAIALLHHAIHSGVTFLDTSDVYGPETNELLLGKALNDMIRCREKVELATKFGATFGDGKREVRGDLEYVRSACETSLKRLDVACIYLYYQHRVDTRVHIEITNIGIYICMSNSKMGELKKLVEESKIKYIVLSEASASTIRRAHAVQLEWSLCRELGIGIVACSALGRGFFASGPKLVENIDNDDYRKTLYDLFDG